MANEPKWEWRAFDEHFGAAEAQILARVTSTSCSEESYLVAEPADVNVKIRDGQLEIKRRVDVDADGLQRWGPVLTRRFPIDATTVADVWKLWRIPPPDHAGGCSEEQMRALAADTPAVTVMRVTKFRRGTVMDGCEVELVHLDIDGKTSHSIGIRSADEAAVHGLVDRLGLSRFHNTDFVAHLQRRRKPAIRDAASR